MIKAQSKPKQDLDFPEKGVDKAVYGKLETKKSIDSIVGMVMRNYNCTSLIEFNTALRQFNGMADRGKRGRPFIRRMAYCIGSWITRGIRSGFP